MPGLLARLAVAVVGTGCSAMFVSAPPTGARPDAPCTESRAAPIADIVASVVLTGVGIAALSDHCDPNVDPFCPAINKDTAPVPGIISLAYAGFAVWSGVRGFQQTDDCRRLHASGSAQPRPLPL